VQAGAETPDGLGLLCFRAGGTRRARLSHQPPRQKEMEVLRRSALSNACGHRSRPEPSSRLRYAGRWRRSAAPIPGRSCPSGLSGPDRAVTSRARSGRDSLRERVQCGGVSPWFRGMARSARRPPGATARLRLDRGRRGHSSAQVAAAEHSLKRSPQRSKNLQRARGRIVGVDGEAQQATGRSFGRLRADRPLVSRSGDLDSEAPVAEGVMTRRPRA
jgi:hypothetical protein